ncbi:MAG: zf-HC2 domain-containing protein [Actinobacteria bacterium]|nr:zf-HC2 domain-containing protein [Actinomycetota bacterium]
MTDCGCDKAKAELEEYLHNELAKQDAADVAEHMANCEDCTEEHMVGLALTLKVRKACREVAPDELMDAIRARLANA